MADWMVENMNATIEALRAQLAEAQASDVESIAMYRRARERAEQAEATIARQRAWIESAGHKDDCRAKNPNDFVGGVFDCEFAPGHCDCGWAELVGG